jgi:3-hydroxyisobutyrate dehydrogenase
MDTGTEIAGKTLGWIGTGVMGASMAGHLLNAGYSMVIYNRTLAKAEPLIAKGARWEESPAKIAAHADIIFTMVGYPQDVEEVYFGPEGVFKSVKHDAILVDMTTTQPSLSVRIAETAISKGAHAVDAPVSGGDVGARNATLSIMAGGEKDIVDSLFPLFQLLGKNIAYQGGPGCGQHAKMCNQIVIAGTMIGVCESLLYAKKSGLNPETMLGAIRGGAAGCWSLDNLAPRILKGDYAPGFYVDHFVKDMGIALEEAAQMGIQLPGLEKVSKLYQKLQKMGHGISGTQALILALEALSEEK